MKGRAMVRFLLVVLLILATDEVAAQDITVTPRDSWRAAPASCDPRRRLSPPPRCPLLPTRRPTRRFSTLGSGAEWRFEPLVVDLNRDGHLDLVATARLTPALHMWRG